jgi:hypothetical protein
MIVEDNDDEIVLNNSISIEIQTASFRSVRGYTVIAALLDEVAFWRSDDSANPDVEILDALRPAMATIPGAFLLGASSPYARRGVLWEAFRTSYGRDDAPALVWHAPTRTMNPTVPQAVIDAAYERDADSASSEYDAQFRSDISDLFDRETIEAAVDDGVLVRPPRPARHAYRAFCDPSGGRGDSFALGVAHDEDNRVLLDLLYERRAPFDPVSVVAEIAELLRQYGVAQVTGDKYAASWCSLAFEKAGIAYVDSDRDKSRVYLDALPLFTAGLVRLIDNRRLVSQLAGLERKITRTGRDIVSHLPGANDDAANAACGALTLVASRPVPCLWDIRAEVARFLALRPEGYA